MTRAVLRRLAQALGTAAGGAVLTFALLATAVDPRLRPAPAVPS